MRLPGDRASAGTPLGINAPVGTTGVACSVDGRGQRCTVGGGMPLGGLASGAHTAVVHGVDAYGNQGPDDSYALTLGLFTCGVSGADDCRARISIPGGTFNRSNEPAYPATIRSFYLDKYEVTVARWRQFLSGGPQQPSYRAGEHLDASGDGDAATCSINDILNVGSRSPAGDGKWGNADLAGNVAERVMDRFDGYSPNPPAAARSRCRRCAAQVVERRRHRGQDRRRCWRAPRCRSRCPATSRSGGITCRSASCARYARWRSRLCAR